ncbi:TraR/DksA family transcriptional regulator [Kribbella sp. NPDC048928]|uniref:TraR/DksA family transcriptional regulator n=1 Tax=Kribbella sp. NPDC048928 TaxID=3364111 RepID=UPI00371456C6
MTDLDQGAPPSTPRDRQTVDTQRYRRDLEHQRSLRLNQLTDLTYEGLAASDDARSEVTAALMRAARAALAEIDAALFRLAIGRFGSCQRCGREIALDRLKTLPMASLCVECQYTVEANGSLRSQVPLWTVRESAAERADREPPAADIVEVWGLASFPASDPLANW